MSGALKRGRQSTAEPRRSSGQGGALSAAASQLPDRCGLGRAPQWHLSAAGPMLSRQSGTLMRSRQSAARPMPCGLGRAGRRAEAPLPVSSAARPMRSGQRGALRRGHHSAARTMQSGQSGALRRGRQEASRRTRSRQSAERRAKARPPVICQTDEVWVGGALRRGHQSAARPRRSRQSGALRRGHQSAFKTDAVWAERAAR